MLKRTVICGLLAVAASGGLTSCDDGKSYAELLDDEEKAVNWYLAQNRVVGAVPPDSVFLEGEDAPFYKIKGDGSVYMRVIKRGDMNDRPKKGQTIYFRFTRYCINDMYSGYDVSGVGNAEDMSSVTSGLSFIYGNSTLESTTQFGMGIQYPLDFLGYNSEIDLIVKSTEGFTSETSSCYAYVYKNLKYFKAEY